MEARFGGTFTGADGNAISNPTAIYQPDFTAVTGFHSKYWVTQAFPDDTISLLDAAARAAIDAAELSARRDERADIIDTPEQYERDFALIVMDEINDLRRTAMETLEAIDNANSLSDVKTAVAGITRMNPRTPAQLKTALRNRSDT